MKRLWFFLGLMPIVGCTIASSPTVTYLSDGRRGYTIECSESLACYEPPAGSAAIVGYKTMMAQVYRTAILTRSVVIACK